ncbi:RiPP maturation radical SAM C-methyltransferase [Paraliomyxa miuraensis]|uniref:RiPP maturation radical SAM C-methyltransferase n=1 Tax=Paraliomyxa miuraensis TaxID=376150 RepID=UPI002254BA98|nr:RiPP maturation radical SAM C-methyltransferase [Paraliomyxa miuraensis]
MPWAQCDMPSAALGILAAFVRDRRPEQRVSCEHAFVEVGQRLGRIYGVVAADDRMGEVLYASLLHPENVARTQEYLRGWLAERDHDEHEIDRAVATVHGALREHAEALAERLAGRHELLGFTTSYNQLFASLLVAKLVRERDPDVRIVLGGMGVPQPTGSSVLEHYPFVDYVIQGAGEQRLVQLLDRLEAGRPTTELEGTLDRAAPGAVGAHAAPREELLDLDALPRPDYDAYAELAERHELRWTIPLEGSRGCWWDRVERTGDVMDTCYFCSLNTTAYREKSPARLAAEMHELADRYEGTSFRFLDNIIRRRGVEELCAHIRERGRDYRFFYEVRAQISPYELLCLWEAGCLEVQIGIEGLSTGYLQRIGKGTTTIQNLQAMRTCYELGISSASNLIVDFPGATAAEVAQTRETILRHAIAYQPADLASFAVYPNSSVHRLPERFGVASMSNAEEFRHALPEPLWQALELFWKDVRYEDEAVDWSPVQEACVRWRRLHRALGASSGVQWFSRLRTLSYRDGGAFLEIIDRRGQLERPGHELVTLQGAAREIFLECLEIQSRADVMRRFAPEHGEAKVMGILDELVAEDLLFHERGRLLSLAVAERPEAAAARIRKAHARRRRASAAPAGPRLAVLSTPRVGEPASTDPASGAPR